VNHERAALLASASCERPSLRSLLMNKISNTTAMAMSMTPHQMTLVDPSLEMYGGDGRERSLLAWILYALSWSALREMSEIGVTLSRFLMIRRSPTIVSTLMASCFLVVKGVSPAMIGQIIAACFLGFRVCGVKSARVACLQGLLSILAFALVYNIVRRAVDVVKYEHSRGVEIL
jgi:hypothetical protein